MNCKNSPLTTVIREIVNFMRAVTLINGFLPNVSITVDNINNKDNHFIKKNTEFGFLVLFDKLNQFYLFSLKNTQLEINIFLFKGNWK